MFSTKTCLLILAASPLILCEIYNCNGDEWATFENSELLIEFIKWREISYLVIFKEDMRAGN